MKILIADDSKADVVLISSILSAYHPLVAYDGVEALELALRRIRMSTY